MFLDLGLPTLIGPVAVMAHLAIATLVTVHVLLYKRNVAASVSWIGNRGGRPDTGFVLGPRAPRRRRYRGLS